jgi:hypothetical protein
MLSGGPPELSNKVYRKWHPIKFHTSHLSVVCARWFSNSYHPSSDSVPAVEVEIVEKTLGEQKWVGDKMHTETLGSIVQPSANLISVFSFQERVVLKA